MAKDYDKEDGVWRTIGGRKVFIRKGQNLADAMKESGKFKSAKKQEDKQEHKEEIKEQPKDEIKDKKEKEFKFKKDKKEEGVPEKSYEIADKINKDFGDKDKITREEFESYLTGTNDDEDAEVRGILGYDGWETKFESDDEGEEGDLVRLSSKNEKERLDQLMKDLRDISNKTATNKLTNDEKLQLHALYAQYLHDKEGKSWDHITSLEENEKDFDKSMNEWSNTKERQDYEKESDNDTINRYKDRIDELNKELKGNINDDERKNKEEQIERLTNGIQKLQAKRKSTNETMNNAIREKASKKKEVEQDLPKATEIKTQGTSNRKEVSENIQAHILEYYDSPDDFVEQMDVFNYLPNNWKRGEEIAKGGSYLIYNGDMADFLDSLKINPKGKKFDEQKAFDMYTSLIGRESAKLYDRIKRNQFNQYKKDHPLTKMTFEDFKDMKK